MPQPVFSTERRHGCRPTSASPRLLANKEKGSTGARMETHLKGGLGHRRRRRGRGAGGGGESRTADELADESPAAAVPVPPSLSLDKMNKEAQVEILQNAKANL